MLVFCIHKNRAIILGIKAGKPIETLAVFGLQPFRPHILVGDGGFPHQAKNTSHQGWCFGLAVPNHLDATLFFEKRAKIYDFYYFFKKCFLFDKLEFIAQSEASVVH